MIQEKIIPPYIRYRQGNRERFGYNVSRTRSDFCQRTRETEFEVAYSNQAFELWFLLHFKKYSGKLHRREYPKLLEKNLGFPYSKQEGVAKMLFPILLPFQSTAISNAEAIITETQGIKPSLAESSTTVHNLVKKLNEYSD